MSGLIILVAVFASLAIFALLAQTHGVDSRPEFEDPRSPARWISA